MLETPFTNWHAPSAPDLYPAGLRDDIDTLSGRIYDTINNGVYKAGFATNQHAYEHAFDALFSMLDTLEDRLANQRFLTGSRLAEADVPAMEWNSPHGRECLPERAR